MQQPNEQAEKENPGVSRRRAIKAGAAVAVGATVWAEPTIRGLAKRPAYASAGSGAPETFNINGLLPPVSPNGTNPGRLDTVGSAGNVLRVRHRIVEPATVPPTADLLLTTRNGSGSGTNTIPGSLSGSITVDGVTYTIAGDSVLLFATITAFTGDVVVTGSISCT